MATASQRLRKGLALPVARSRAGGTFSSLSLFWGGHFPHGVYLRCGCSIASPHGGIKKPHLYLSSLYKVEEYKWFVNVWSWSLRAFLRDMGVKVPVGWLGGDTSPAGTLCWPQAAGLAKPSALHWAADPRDRGLHGAEAQQGPRLPSPTGQPGCELGPSLPSDDAVPVTWGFTVPRVPPGQPEGHHSRTHPPGLGIPSQGGHTGWGREGRTWQRPQPPAPVCHPAAMPGHCVPPEGGAWTR